MFKEFENILTEIIRTKYDNSFSFKDDELEDAIQQTMNHLLVHNIFFLKDIKCEEFIESLWQYVLIKRRMC